MNRVSSEEISKDADPPFGAARVLRQSAPPAGVFWVKAAATDPGGETIGEAAYRRIRADIVFGRLAPGQKLGLDRMRDSYGAATAKAQDIAAKVDPVVKAQPYRAIAIAAAVGFAVGHLTAALGPKVVFVERA